MDMNNTSHRAVMAQRRELVARFRLRHRTIVEIQGDLAAAGCVNPDDGTPWSVGTISNDLKRLEKEWRDAAAASIEARKAAQMAELDEARRRAWEQDDINLVRLLIETEMKLLGTAAPKRTEVTGTDGEPLVTRIEVVQQTGGYQDNQQATNAAAITAIAIALPDTDDGADDDDDGDDELA